MVNCPEMMALPLVISVFGTLHINGGGTDQLIVQKDAEAFAGAGNVTGEFAKGVGPFVGEGEFDFPGIAGADGHLAVVRR